MAPDQREELLGRKRLLREVVAVAQRHLPAKGGIAAVAAYEHDAEIGGI